ncbi:MAG: 16S rRNA (cytosine(967)-C(5))-methyltransferase RsmB [Halioglobus sp.]
MKTLDPRAAGARIIGQVLTGKSLNQAMPNVLPAVAERDRALVQQICYGTLRSAPQIQALLDQLLDKPLRAKDQDVYALLMTGIYQLDGMRIPDHAAVAATVDASRGLKKPWAKGLANAILRRYQREKETLAEALSPAQAEAHPAWLYGKLKKQWPNAAASIVAANNNPPPMSLRVNTLKTDRDSYLKQLAAAGIVASASDLAPQGVRLERAVDVELLPGFQQGLASVQDEAAQMAAILVAPQPGDRILDACAAPGGKSCHILELQPQLAELVAADIDAVRLEKVRDNLGRLSLEATLEIHNAAHEGDNTANAQFDRILVDAPCSATGVLRRNPDVKILRQADDITLFATQQLDILTGLWPRLKPGGLMVYATCSILDEENSRVVASFLEQHQDAQLRVPNVTWGEPTACGRQILPSVDGPDGLYYALIEKLG